MSKVWNVIVSTERMGGGPPLKEYFLVARHDQVAALIALRQLRPDLIGGDFNVVGTTSPQFVEWLDIKDGQILGIAVLK